MPLLRRASRLALRKGMQRGSREWITLGLLLGVGGWARKRAARPPKALHREVLEPGEAITISVIDPRAE